MDEPFARRASNDFTMNRSWRMAYHIILGKGPRERPAGFVGGVVIPWRAHRIQRLATAEVNRGARAIDFVDRRCP